MCGNAVVTNANRASVNDEVPPILSTSLSPADPEAVQGGGGGVNHADRVEADWRVECVHLKDRTPA